MIAALDAAGLAAARPWRAARKEAAAPLLQVAVADFRHRPWLERDPHRLLEGLLIAAWCCGSNVASVLVHPAWHGCRALLQQELARLAVEPPAGGGARIELREAGGQAALVQDFGPLFHLRALLEHGPAWFANRAGREDFQARAN